MTSSHSYLFFYPNAPDARVVPLEIPDDDYGGQALKAGMAEYKLADRDVSDFMLLQAGDIESRPKDTLFARTREWLKHHRNDLDKVAVKIVDSVQDLDLFKAFNRRMIHFIIVSSELLESLDEAPEYMSILDSATRGREKAVRSIALMESPSGSQVVKSVKAIKNTVLSPDLPICYGRPFNTHQGLPTSLYEPILADFCEEIRQLDTIYAEPPSDDLKDAAFFVRTCLQFFDSEDSRQQSLQSCLLFQDANDDIHWDSQTHSKETGSTGHPTEVGIDIVWKLFAGTPGEAVYMILELKNEVGLYGDPFLQSIISYVKNLGTQSANRKSNFPVILIGLAGHHLKIGVGLFTDAVYVDSVMSVDLLERPFSDVVMRVARISLAVRKAKTALRKFYSQARASGEKRSIVSIHAPNPTTIDGSKPPQLSYLSKLCLDGKKDLFDPAIRDGPVFLAKLVDSPAEERVVVKFPETYCEAAHATLAQHGLAPALHFCGRLKGGLWMVVMDFVEGTAGSRLATPLPHKYYEKLKKAVELLHAQNLVFGDLRGQNVIFNKATDDLKLIDFDMAGVEGEQRYPSTLNSQPHWTGWPKGMEPGMLMMKEHDLQWLELLRKECEAS